MPAFPMAPLSPTAAENVLDEELPISRAGDIARAIESNPSVLYPILATICETNQTYVQIARLHLNGQLSEEDSDIDIRSGVSYVAVKYLSERVRALHAQRVRHQLTSDDCRKGAEASRANGGKTAFTRAEQIRGIKRRGARVWEDAEQFILIALASDPSFQKEQKNGHVVLWEEVARKMNVYFPAVGFQSLQCRKHFEKILYRYRRGQYGRGMPESRIEAYADALDASVGRIERGEEVLNQISSHTIAEIRRTLFAMEVAQAQGKSATELALEDGPYDRLYTRATRVLAHGNGKHH
jgi:hypothetical protein